MLVLKYFLRRAFANGMLLVATPQLPIEQMHRFIELFRRLVCSQIYCHNRYKLRGQLFNFSTLSRMCDYDLLTLG